MHEGMESAYRWSIYVPIVSLNKNLLCLVEDVVIEAVQECVWVDVLVWKEIFLHQVVDLCSPILIVSARLLTILSSFFNACLGVFI